MPVIREGQSWTYSRVGINPYNGRDEASLELEVYAAPGYLSVSIGSITDAKLLDWASYTADLNEEEARSLYTFLKEELGE